MNHVPSVRSLREAILEQARQSAPDPVALEGLRTSAIACVRGMRRAIDRAREFAEQGLVSEAAGLVEDYPDLARQAQALLELPGSDPAIQRIWVEQIDTETLPLPMPTVDEIDALANYTSEAESQRVLLDSLRVAVLRNEPVSARLRILRKLRAADSRNRMWLDQIEAVEQEWLKQFSNLRGKADATREELEVALSALESNEWIATVPRGLKEEIYQKVKPLRAEEAGARYAALSEQIHDAAARMDREGLVTLEAEWSRINEETGRMPDPAIAEAVAPAFEWLSRLEREERAKAEFDAQVELLEQLLLAQRPTVDIERQIAVLRDAALPAPEGILTRAMNYVEAERLRLRRRHRMVVISSLLAACVLAVVGIIALQMHSVRQRAAQELAALQAAIEAKDVQQAHALAEELRARGGPMAAELAAALDAEKRMFDARAALTAEVRQAIGRARAELDGGASRKRLMAMNGELAKLRADAAEQELRELDQLEARRASALVNLDLEHEKLAKSTEQAVQKSLASWPMPDQWTDAQWLDPLRWKEYIRALEAESSAVGNALATVEGFDPAVTRLNLVTNGLTQRRDEAGKRLAELERALAELEFDRLCRKETSEQKFNEHIARIVADHATTLARKKWLNGFTAVKNLHEGYEAVERWRSVTLPDLRVQLGSMLVPSEDVDKCQKARDLIREYLAKFPGAPSRDTLDALSKALDPGPLVRRIGAADFLNELIKRRFADLEEVPLRNSRRFYRRPSLAPNPTSEQMKALNRAVENLADFTMDAERLDAILSVNPTDIEGRPTPNSISKIWKRAQNRVGGAKAGELPDAVLEVLAELRSDTESDGLLRFRAIVEYVGILLQSGYVPAPALVDIESWRKEIDRVAEAAITCDWAKAGWDDPVNFRRAREEAAFALKRFPDIAKLVDTSKKARAEVAKAVRAYRIVGTLTPKDGSEGERRLHDERLSGVYQVLDKVGTSWRFVDITLKEGKLVSGAGLPDGPVLVYAPQGENPS